jgi:hypothetical protein
VREQIARGLELFVSAAMEQRVDKVLSVGMQMQEAVGRIFLEAYAMSADLDLRELPGRDKKDQAVAFRGGSLESEQVFGSEIKEGDSSARPPGCM